MRGDSRFLELILLSNLISSDTPRLGTLAPHLHAARLQKASSSLGRPLLAKNFRVVMVGSKRDFRFRRQKHIYAGMKNRGFAITIEPHTK